jgi:hypothetical protein
MKYLLLLLIGPVMMSETCKKKKESADIPNKDGNTPAASIPACIQQRIDSIKKEPKWNPPAEVNEYTYNGKTVYAFSSPCCDFFNPVYGSDCNYLCAPDGGFTGKGDGKCADFSATAKHVKLIWKDDRK